LAKEIFCFVACRALKSKFFIEDTPDNRIELAYFPYDTPDDRRFIELGVEKLECIDTADMSIELAYFPYDTPDDRGFIELRVEKPERITGGEGAPNFACSFLIRS